MGWTFSVDGGPASGFTTRAQDAADQWTAAHPDEATPEALEQIGCCIGAAGGMLSAIGGGDPDVAASFSGHANPAHEGSSPDTLSVSVYRRAAQPA